MFTTDYYIDTFQNAKKTFVNTFVTNEGVKNALNAFVDGQTAYTKAAIKTTTDVNTKLAAEATKSFTDFTKFDASKFDMTKFFKVSK